MTKKATAKTAPPKAKPANDSPPLQPLVSAKTEQIDAMTNAVEAKPVIHRITRLDQAQAIAELAKDEKFTDATDEHTDIQAFKSSDGRTLRVVLAGDSLNSVEI